MNLILTVLEVVAPVFLLATIGFAWVKLGFEYRIQFVTQMSMTLALPCLIFVSLMKTTIDSKSLSTVFAASIIAYLLVTVAMFVWVRTTQLDLRTYLAPFIFGNTGNLGLPLALFAFGEQGLGYAVVIFAAMAIYSFTVGVWLVSGGGSLLRVVQEPIVAATLLGGLFWSQGWQTPLFLTNTLDLVGQMAIPLMLITLGVSVARLSLRHFGRAIWMSILKVAICAAIATGVGMVFQLSDVAFGVLVLQLAMPVAVTNYLLAEKYGADAEAVAGLCVMSTLASIITIPLILAFVI